MSTFVLNCDSHSIFLCSGFSCICMFVWAWKLWSDRWRFGIPHSRMPQCKQLLTCSIRNSFFGIWISGICSKLVPASVSVWNRRWLIELSSLADRTSMALHAEGMSICRCSCWAVTGFDPMLIFHASVPEGSHRLALNKYRSHI